MKTYYGFRTYGDRCLVMVSQTPAGMEEGKMATDNTQPLALGPSLKAAYHSPTGFEWGYEGSGPAQLALAILLDLAQTVEEEQAALEGYQQFKRDMIALLPQKRWELTEASIRQWQAQAKGGK